MASDAEKMLTARCLPCYLCKHERYYRWAKIYHRGVRAVASAWFGGEHIWVSSAPRPSGARTGFAEAPGDRGKKISKIVLTFAGCASKVIIMEIIEIRFTRVFTVSASNSVNCKPFRVSRVLAMLASNICHIKS